MSGKKWRQSLTEGGTFITLKAIDGKHIAVWFLWAYVGANGSSSDCGVFHRSSLGPALCEGTLGLPLPEPLPEDDRDTPYFIVGDDAFPLRGYLVRPFPHRFLGHAERFFNYRCSRARRVVENAFGILAARFRCLHKTLLTTHGNAKKVVKEHLMRDHYPNLQNADLDQEDDDEVIPGSWRDVGVMEDMERHGRGPRETREGKQLRKYMKHYYCSEVGSVPWQENAIDGPLR